MSGEAKPRLTTVEAPGDAAATCEIPSRMDSEQVQLMQRWAFGYRDKESFKLRLLGLHRCKHALVG